METKKTPHQKLRDNAEEARRLGFKNIPSRLSKKELDRLKQSLIIPINTPQNIEIEKKFENFNKLKEEIEILSIPIIQEPEEILEEIPEELEEILEEIPEEKEIIPFIMEPIEPDFDFEELNKLYQNMKHIETSIKVIDEHEKNIYDICKLIDENKHKFLCSKYNEWEEWFVGKNNNKLFEEDKLMKQISLSVKYFYHIYSDKEFNLDYIKPALFIIESVNKYCNGVFPKKELKNYYRNKYYFVSNNNYSFSTGIPITF